MNKKERRLALATALQSAAADMVVVKDFGSFEEAKTRALLAKLEAVGVNTVRGRAGGWRWDKEHAQTRFWRRAPAQVPPGLTPPRDRLLPPPPLAAAGEEDAADPGRAEPRCGPRRT